MAVQRPIINRYRRYKAGTQQVVKWLVSTASQCSSNISRRFHYTTTLATEDPAPSTRAYQDIIISTADLKELAVAITVADPPIPVSTDILRVLKDVVELRKECGEWYASQATSEEDDNKRHAHFVRTLEDIHELLRPNPNDTAVPTASNTKQRKTKAKVNRQLNNLFSSLDLEEPSAAPLGEAPSADRKVPTPHVTLADDEDFDKRMTLFCFLVDMNDIRCWLRAAWTGYRDHLYSLDTAGLITETAFEMMHRCYDEFVVAQPQFGSWDSIVEFLQLRVALNNNVLYIYPKEDIVLAREVSKSGINMADLLCTPGNIVLEGFQKAVGPYMRSAVANKTPTQTSQFAGDIPLANTKGPASAFQQILFSILPEINVIKRATLRYKERLVEEQQNLGSRISEVSTMKWLSMSNHRSTKFTEALLEVCDSAEPPPFWATVICQCQMDIHDILGHARASYPGDTLVKSADKVIDTCKDALKLPYPSAVLETRKEALEAPRVMAEDVKFIIQKGRELDEARAKQKKRLPHLRGVDVSEVNQGRRCVPGLDVFPAAAGEVLYCLKVMMHDFGSSVINDLNCVLSLAHLYKAGRKYGLLDRWDDMEFLVSQHSTVKPYVTETHIAAGPYAMLKHFLLDYGVDAVTLAKKKVPDPPLHKESMWKKAKKISSTISPLRSALEKLYSQREDSHVDSGKIMEAVLRTLAQESKSRSDAGSRSKNEAKSSLFTPTQLLDTLRSHLIENEPRVNFDYSKFMRMCLIEITPAIIVHGLDSNPAFANQPTYYLLKMAADAEDSGIPVKSTSFARACDYFNKLISERGAQFSQAAYSRSSGHMHKHIKSEAPKDEQPGLQKSLDTVKNLFQDSTIGFSRSAIEIYHPTGSAAEFKKHLTNNAFRNIMQNEPARRTLFKGPSIDGEEYNEEMQFFVMNGREDEYEPPPTIDPEVWEQLKKSGLFGAIIA